MENLRNFFLQYNLITTLIYAYGHQKIISYMYSEWNTTFFIVSYEKLQNTDLLQNGPSNFSALPIDQSNILFDNIENPIKEEGVIVEREEDYLDLGGDANVKNLVEDSLLGIIIYFPLSQIIRPITI